ncbi:hypothetical protein B0O99DRAFT_634829 [Bisporella sp. PMI_857]|nr:hypothetical protein B0O99DRAFT_634829 [Bisporella sp. PMI_857]
MDPPGAGERFVSLILGDEGITISCKKALEYIAVGELERIVRRLLKELAIDLRSEAESHEQRRAARFIRYRARNSAHLICNSFVAVRQPKAIEQENEQENVSDNEIESDASADNDFQYLESLIKLSKAMQRLRGKLRDLEESLTLDKENPKLTRLSLPQTSSSNLLGGESEIDKRSKLFLEDNNSEIRATPLASPSFNPVEIKLNDDFDEVSDALEWWNFVNVEKYTENADSTYIARTKIGKLVLDYSYSRIEKATNSIMSAIAYFRTLPVAPGMTRVNWKCACGYTSYDDFKELKSGAAEKLKLEISCSMDKVSSTPRSYMSRFFQSFSNGNFSLNSVLSFKRSQRSPPDLPLHEIQPLSNENNVRQTQLPNPSLPQPERIYLLLCYNEGRYATRLLQLDLMELKAHSDLTIFKLLRENYESMRGHLKRWVSLHTLTSIKFVHFELHVGELVDVRKQDVIPPPECCDYQYKPMPPKLVPPVGERYMMHLFHHPSSAHTSSVCLDRFPKKLLEKITSCPNGPKPGWGLQFIENWDQRKIAGLIFFLFLSSSLLFGVLWSVYKHDIQSAFAIASYVVAFAGISVITVQAFLVL